MEITRGDPFADSPEDIRDRRIYARVCELIKKPDYLAGIVAQYAPHACMGDADLQMIAKAILSDDDRVVDRGLMDAVIESVWQLAEYEWEAMEAGVYH